MKRKIFEERKIFVQKQRKCEPRNFTIAHTISLVFILIVDTVSDRTRSIVGRGMTRVILARVNFPKGRTLTEQSNIVLAYR